VVFTQLLSQKDLSNDESLRACPAIYQEYVNKQSELRVTVVGSKVYACEIHSQATEQTRIDWRRYDLPNTPHRAYKLTTDIEAKCLAITRHFGLMFSTIDLVVRPDGQVVFLEMNPNGQWGWIEELTGLPIARSIAELLIKGG
jgi:glutathione synthase/RimK-type ligase-like ATP-grasp enzyme